MLLSKREVTLKKCSWCETSRKFDRMSAHKRTERDHEDFSYIYKIFRWSFLFQEEDADDNRESIDLTALGLFNAQQSAPYS